MPLCLGFLSTERWWCPSALRQGQDPTSCQEHVPLGEAGVDRPVTRVTKPEDVLTFRLEDNLSELNQQLNQLQCFLLLFSIDCVLSRLSDRLSYLKMITRTLANILGYSFLDTNISASTLSVLFFSQIQKFPGTGSRSLEPSVEFLFFARLLNTDFLRRSGFAAACFIWGLSPQGIFLLY